MRGVHLSLVGAMVAGGWMNVVVGCRHAAPSKPMEGQSFFQMVNPPAPPSTGNAKMAMSVASSREVSVDATPILPLATPVYPAVARAAKLGVVSFTVHLTVDTRGRVSSVAPSLGAFSLPNKFSAEFQAAVEAAVAQWRFTPAEIHHMEDARGTDGGTYLRLASREKIDAGCDVQFTFTATGEVWTGAPEQRR